MVGIFDSGMGGAFALAELRRLSPAIDIAFFADTENAPYGTKSEEELVKLVSADIEKLTVLGAKKVLMACCTASTVYGKLDEKYRKIAIPIIEPVARAAVSKTKCGAIGILSTEATKKSRAFPKALSSIDGEINVTSVSSGELVTLAECGAKDGMLSEGQREIIDKTITPFKNSGIDTLILGCTHFAYFEKEIQDILGVETVNSAKVGAEQMAKIAKNEGQGRTIMI